MSMIRMKILPNITNNECPAALLRGAALPV